jgi:hypothetical protein
MYVMENATHLLCVTENDHISPMSLFNFFHPFMLLASENTNGGTFFHPLCAIVFNFFHPLYAIVVTEFFTAIG